jgi:hypothetical protein
VVWWNDKRRGVRLGTMRHAMGLAIHCTACGHSSRIRRRVSLRLWGERTRARDVARDLRCTRCGEAKACVQVMTDTRIHERRTEDPDGGWPIGPEVDPPPPK